MLLGAITLPDTLLWKDEFTWAKVLKQVGYSANGALLIEESVKQTGRTITLIGQANVDVVNRTTLLALLTQAELTGNELTLVFEDARSFNVMFASEKPIEFNPIVSYNALSTGALFEIVAINLMEV